jgi:RimJ/RimL family protein N-acetyltransferase
MTHVLETPRLVLREMDMADVDAVARMLADPEVMRFWPRPYTRGEAEGWVRRQMERYARDGCGYWLALSKAESRPVGQAGVLMIEIDGAERPSLGYIIDRPFWRNGYATEAAAASRDWVFGTLGRSEVFTLIRPENNPSLGVALKLGMVAERRVMRAGYEHILFSVSRKAGL